jgi:thioredoxin reductase
MQAVIIIGAGPAGITTAIQLRRYGLSPLLFESNRVGGLLWNANLVENYPGFPEGIAGPALVTRFKEQLERHTQPIQSECIVQVEKTSAGFLVHSNKAQYRANIIVLASGTVPHTFTSFDIPSEIHSRIFYEVYPLTKCKQQTIIIVGAGDAAFDYALNLGRANKIIILNRTDHHKCLPLLWERVKDVPNIQYLTNTRITSLRGGENKKIRLQCSCPDGAIELKADYLLGAIGRKPNLSYLTPHVQAELQELRAGGLVHLIGDVQRGIFRQTSIAVGDGMIAAMQIYRYLLETKK